MLGIPTEDKIMHRMIGAIEDEYHFMLQCEKQFIKGISSVDVLNVFPYFTQLSISDQLHLLLSESIIMPMVGHFFFEKR
jgi:hypothetical protein